MFNSQGTSGWMNSTSSGFQGDKNTYTYSQNNNFIQGGNSYGLTHCKKLSIESEVENVFYEECMKLKKEDFQTIIYSSGQHNSKQGK